MNVVEMPDRVVENLVVFIRRNNGVLSRKQRHGQFNKLNDGEVTVLEGIVREAFEGFDDASLHPVGGDANDE